MAALGWLLNLGFAAGGVAAEEVVTGGPGWAGLMSQRAFDETTLAKRTLAKRRKRIRKEIAQIEELETPRQVRQEAQRVLATQENIRLRALRIEQAQALEKALEELGEEVSRGTLIEVNDDEEVLALYLEYLERQNLAIVQVFAEVKDRLH